MHKTNPGSSARLCPVCESKGQPVKPITIESLVNEEARRRVGSSEDYRFCSKASCNVAYFNAESLAQVTRSEVLVRIGQKEDEPSRPICYCFEHTADEIANEVSATGSSSIADEIAEQCGQGLQRCEQTNPQGSCCLGNVRQVIREAQRHPARGAATAEVFATESCCASVDTSAVETKARQTSRGGWLAPSGAVVAAALSSACCWLPLLLIGLGASTVGVAGFVESYRPYLLGVTALFLSGGFYLVYGRRQTCTADGSCAATAPPRDRIQRITLWAATVFAVGFALFPDYVGLFLGEGQSPSGVEAAAGGESRVFQIDGMTCEACAVTLREALLDVQGVAGVEISFETQTARVSSAESDSLAQSTTILEAVRLAGFSGHQIP